MNKKKINYKNMLKIQKKNLIMIIYYVMIWYMILILKYVGNKSNKEH
jgi:hypothetical protein